MSSDDRPPWITWAGVKAVCKLTFWSAAALLVEWPPLITLAFLALVALGGWLATGVLSGSTMR